MTVGPTLANLSGPGAINHRIVGDNLVIDRVVNGAVVEVGYVVGNVRGIQGLAGGLTPAQQEVFDALKSRVDAAVPIFATLALARAFETANPGKVALSLEKAFTLPDKDATDATAPVAGTLSTAVQGTTVVLNVAGASDNKSFLGYAFKLGTGAWSAWQAASTFRIEGLTLGTDYTVQHKVIDSGWNETTGAAKSFSTPAAPLLPGTVITSDTFTRTGTLHATNTNTALGGTPKTWAVTGAGTWNTDGNGLVRATAAGRASLPLALDNFEILISIERASMSTSGTASGVSRQQLWTRIDGSRYLELSFGDRLGCLWWGIDGVARGGSNTQPVDWTKPVKVTVQGMTLKWDFTDVYGTVGGPTQALTEMTGGSLAFVNENAPTGASRIKSLKVTQL